MPASRLENPISSISGVYPSSGQITPSRNEAPILFERKGTYYLMFGPICCFCHQGSGIEVWTALHLLGLFKIWILGWAFKPKFHNDQKWNLICFYKLKGAGKIEHSCKNKVLQKLSWFLKKKIALKIRNLLFLMAFLVIEKDLTPLYTLVWMSNLKLKS